MSQSLIELIVEVEEFVDVGYSSWTTGFVCRTASVFDELSKCPEAVFNRLCNKGRWDLAEEVLDRYL